jgi:hypothetical protein
MWWRKKHQTERPVLRCSFCNKWQHDVRDLIAGPNVLICDECVQVCDDILADAERVEKRHGRKTPGRADSPTPWPNTIQCALCRLPILVDGGFVISGNRGTLCADCVNAVQAARVNGQ